LADWMIIVKASAVNIYFLFKDRFNGRRSLLDYCDNFGGLLDREI
jgi:hypothetical protein